MDTKVYYKCESIEEEASLSFYSGVMPIKKEGEVVFPACEEVEEIAREFGITLTPTTYRAFFMDGVGYQISWKRNWDGRREPVLTRSTTVLVEEGDEFNVSPNSDFVHAYFIGISKGGFLFDKDNNEVDSIKDWAAAWQEELRQDLAKL